MNPCANAEVAHYLKRRFGEAVKAKPLGKSKRRPPRKKVLFTVVVAEPLCEPCWGRHCRRVTAFRIVEGTPMCEECFTS